MSETDLKIYPSDPSDYDDRRKLQREGVKREVLPIFMPKKSRRGKPNIRRLNYVDQEMRARDSNWGRRR